MPKCPLCRTEHEPNCGIRLFDSANECAICMENCKEMIALPCGHQFCSDDMKKMGFIIPGFHLSATQGQVMVPGATQGQVMAPGAFPLMSSQLMALHELYPDPESSPEPPAYPPGEPPAYPPGEPSLDSFMVDLSSVRRQRRCGWCGYTGHNQRNCMDHQEECGCDTLRSSQHKRLYRLKPRCSTCGKKGHNTACNTIVLNDE